MALTNSQYNEVMREYERQQIANRHDRDARVAEAYARVPRLRALDALTASKGAAFARRALEGDPRAGEALREELDTLRTEKETLMREAGYPVDFMELRYRCPDCRDTGFTEGRRCHCFEQARIRILYDQSNIREVLERENFSTLSEDCYDDKQQLQGLGMTQREYMRRVVRQCREFASGFPEHGRNLLFTGGTGVGKTFLANCIAREVIDRYFSVIYLSSQDLFELLSRYKFSREVSEESEESYRHILDCDLLIIDDLGTEVNNTFVSSQLFYCVNERILRQKGTVISTNLSPGMLRDTYSDRTASRIMSNYTAIPLYGGDIRLKRRGFHPDHTRISE
ncbi:MAG: ATP-binding protein [Clostridiales bacterium]|nr:ATP-binding protein [Clostridiales bacterium]